MKQAGYLVQTYERHTWRTLFSLPASLCTAMLLLDYTIHGSAAPKGWPATMLARLSKQALADLEGMRAILAHGAILRGFLLQQISSAMSAQQEWDALLNWLTNLTEASMRQLITYGIRSNLEYYRSYPHLPRVPEVARLLEELEAAETVLEDEEYRKRAIHTILDDWGIQEHGPPLALIEHPDRLRAAITGFLGELWEQGFAEAWEQRKASLTATMEATQDWLTREAVAYLPDEVVFRVTGLQLKEEWIPVLQRASTVVFVPCLFLDKYLSLAVEGDTLNIFYEPKVTPVLLADYSARQEVYARGAQQSASRLAESQQAYASASPVLDLAEFGQAIRTLGDPTSLSILTALAEEGEMFAQQVAEKLEVHQSTISRHFSQLERTGLVSVRPEGSMKFYSANRERIKEICQLLLKTFA
ncbi:ArsR/SmtB family transcription factor [Ktedonosporobacter rubrisoli]|nr:metalloregulator ArsR/SmtB family transcription factor [Ktedonosporobacter rubrisoli]